MLKERKKLEREMIQLVSRIESAGQRNFELGEKVISFAKQSKVDQTELVALSSQVRSYKVRVKTLENQLRQIHRRSGQDSDIVRGLQRKLSDVTCLKERYQVEINKLRQVLEHGAKQQRGEAVKRVSILVQCRDDMKATVEDHTAELVGEMKALQHQMGSERKRCAVLLTNEKTLLRDIQERNTAITKLQLTLSMLQKQVRKENAQPKTHFAQLGGQWEAISKDQHATADATAERYRYDFKRLMAEHKTEKRTLRDQVAKMERQLRTAGLVADSLESRSLNVDRAITFLNCHQTQVTGNWRRLEDLLRHHKAGRFPPSEWKALTNVSSADDLFANPGPYVSKSGSDTDTDEKGDGGPESGGDGTGSHGRHTTFLDLTGDPSSGDSSHDESRQKTAGRARKAPDFILARSTQCVLQTKIISPTRRLRASRSQHEIAGKREHCSHFFIAHDLADMLARMMFWNKLDETDWTSFVPAIYYLSAENALDQYERDHKHPEFWPDLVYRTQGDGDILLLVSNDEAEVDNEKRDTTWNQSKKAQAKIARWSVMKLTSRREDRMKRFRMTTRKRRHPLRLGES
ncbi:myosin-like protein [Phytophthora cinnamomi]|uniref:myosin-like protein n=1 Tax=Phytophthora cinnamomi TaxID=4785 RepID=UPI003559C545|nr:myosin-like protein [Phytophthora cinnamomi]